jgi:hypothetical protein
MPELKFDEKRHLYSINGMNLPSVTAIMRPLSNEYYGGIDAEIMAVAAKRGKTVHQSIENYLKFGIDDLPPEHEGYYSAFKSWISEINPRTIEAESKVYHKIMRYAGTADLPCYIGETLMCVDFKTTAQIVGMLTRVQLEAYSKAYESHGFKFGGKAIVQLQKDGNWAMKIFEAGDSEAWEVFGSLLTVSNYISKHRR